MKKLEIQAVNTALYFDLNSDTFSVRHYGHLWQQDRLYRTGITIRAGGELLTLYFSEASHRTVEEIHTGVGDGWRVTYTGWRRNGGMFTLSLETCVWLERSTGHVYCEAIPLCDTCEVTELRWPAPFEWTTLTEKAVTVLPMMQGTLVPNNWPEKVDVIQPSYFYDRAGYMPWLGQYVNGHGCLQIITTPWDCGYHFSHPAGGPTSLSLFFRASLGRVRYKRSIRMEFFKNCDYNTFCAAYRRYLLENGKLKTLAQNALENPKLYQLAGSGVVHSCIQFKVKPEAAIYDRNDPQNNDRFATFLQRADQLKELHRKGLQHIYFHLDGWGQHGYDWQHPDILPPCPSAGGAREMYALAEICRQENILFALHDQYRDYYLDAETYDAQNAVHGYEQSLPGECTWNGGQQNYLCASLAQDYVRRNYLVLEGLGIVPDGAYLDVFSIVPPDECSHPEHQMSRRECLEYRAGCCELLRARGLLLSSEEAADHLIPHLELCHHAPHPGVVGADGNVKSLGIPVPLLNLVYHDCLMIPWHVNDSVDGRIDGKSRWLYAILNAGMPYVDIVAEKDEILRANEISELQRRLAFQPMIRHEFLNEDRTIERTTFADGTCITVNFALEYYEVASSVAPSNVDVHASQIGV